MGTYRWLRVSFVNALLFLGLTVAAHSAFSATGRTTGYFNVSQAGTAEYTVPLWAPPGAGGMRPELAISYSHARGNGILGMGFQINGMSVIHRCAMTIAQDGADGPITLTNSDVFCLDGSRLRLESGSPYGGPGTTYRTERETFVRVTANGSGPGWFEVRHKNGLIYEYGNSVDSRIDFGGGAARSWALSSIRDRGGNRIDFTYIEDGANGSFRPNAINYASNPTAGVSTAPYQILFVYDTVNRPDPIYGNYPAGGPENEIKRLEKIEIRYSGSPVKIYRFTYEPIGGAVTRSRLLNIQECSTTVSDCLADTDLSWSSGVAGLQAEQNPSQIAATSVHLIDVDGDGRDDMVYTSHATSGLGTWRIRKGNSSGGFDAEINTFISNAGYPNARPLEWDGDGRIDLLVPYALNKWHVLQSTGSGFATPWDTGITAAPPYENTLDINGDGLDDLVRMSASGEAKVFVRYREATNFGMESVVWSAGSPNVQFWSWFPPTDFRYRTRTRRADFDGDGKEDFIGWLSEYDPESGLTGYYTARMYAGQPAIFDSGPDLGGIHLYGDINDDGLTDIVWVTSYGLRLLHGGSTTIIQGPATSNLYTQYHVIVDHDGDGREDILAQHTSTLQLQFLRNTGTNFASGVATPYSYPSFTIFRTGDVNGDGFADLVSWTSNQVKYRLHEPYFADLLLEAKDGFEVKAAFTYAPLTDATVYTKGTGAVAPQYDYQGGMPVVKQVTATDGTGLNSTYTLSFTYEAARRDRWGRGFVGFAKRTMVDSRLGYNVKTEQTYLQTWPHTGLLSSATLKQSSGTEISKTTNTWAAVTYSSGYSIRHFPHLSSSSTQRREVGGTYNGTHIVTDATTVASIDSTSGLITDATTTTTEVATGLNGGSSKTERVFHSAVFNDTANWCIGRPDYSQVINSHTLPGGASKTRTVDPTWDGLKCRVTQQVIEPGDPNWAVTTALGYDAFGNVASQAVTGVGMSARTTTISWGSAGQFPESITQSVSSTFSQTTAQAFRYDLGLRTSITDPNGLVTNFQYDAFGRLTQETRPDGTDTTWTITAYSGDPPRSRYFVDEIWRRTDDVAIQQTQVYFDQFDRAYQQLAQVPASGGYSWSTTKVDFDARGRVMTRFNPWFSGGAGAGYWSFTYDQIDRVSAEKLYTAAGALDRQITHAFNGLSVTTTDPKTYQTIRYATAWGDFARVTDAESGNTNYQYEAFGLPTQVTDAYGNVVNSIGYNVRGMKTSSTDMDMGSWSFLPNALGELEKIRDAKTAYPSWTSQTTFDDLGRPKQRIEAEGTTNLIYGTSAAAKNIGRLESISGPGYSEILTYDSKARLATRSITTDTSYQIDLAYDDQTGLRSTLTYPTSTSGYRFKLQYDYSFGTLSKVKRFDSPYTEYWKLNALDARGNALDEDLGNGLKVVSGFDPLTGLIDYRQSGPSGSATIQNLAYDWDLNGNLFERQDLRQGLTEIFTYDGLNRLRTATLGGSQTFIDYDLIGNITRKTDVSAGTWSYHGSKKHAVTATGGGPTYGYDANGKVSSKSGATIAWTSFNRPSAINGSGVSSQFWYGPDRQRFKQAANYSGGTETTHYVGGVLEKLVTGSNTHYRHVIAGPTGLIAIYTRRVTGSPLEDTFYFTHDHQGNADSITKADGTVQVRLSYDAFGKRRQEAGWSGSLPGADWTAIANSSRRGYTEHEHLDNLGLIHMNGRVQDPLIGRFLSADPFVPHPSNGQSLNRYSYVRNNPLTLVDPSGFWESWFIHWADDMSQIDAVTVTASRIFDSFGNAGMLDLWTESGTLGGDNSSGDGGGATSGNGQTVPNGTETEQQKENTPRECTMPAPKVSAMMQYGIFGQLKVKIWGVRIGVDINLMRLNDPLGEPIFWDQGIGIGASFGGRDFWLGFERTDPGGYSESDWQFYGQVDRVTASAEGLAWGIEAGLIVGGEVHIDRLESLLPTGDTPCKN